MDVEHLKWWLNQRRRKGNSSDHASSYLWPPCDMDPVLKIAREHGLVVVEDAAEAHGAEYFGKMLAQDT